MKFFDMQTRRIGILILVINLWFNVLPRDLSADVWFIRALQRFGSPYTETDDDGSLVMDSI